MKRSELYTKDSALSREIEGLSEDINPVVLFELAVKTATDMYEFSLGSQCDYGGLEMMMPCDKCEGWISIDTGVYFPWEDEEEGLDYSHPEMLDILDNYNGIGQDHLVKGVNFALCICNIEDNSEDIDSEAWEEEKMNLLFKEKFVRVLNEYKSGKIGIKFFRCEECGWEWHIIISEEEVENDLGEVFCGRCGNNMQMVNNKEVEKEQ